MAVYTPLTEAELKAFCRFFGLGKLMAFEGIAAGTINTIYRLTTESGDFSLRVLEDRDPDDAEFECRILAKLAADNLPVPAAIEAKGGGFVAEHGPRQPVVVSTWCAGRSLSVTEVTEEVCGAIGHFLGQMHRSLDGWKPPENPFSPPNMVTQWRRCQRAVEERGADFSPGAADDLRAIGEALDGGWRDDLDMVVTHQDLFRDNALFDEDRLGAVIDFEMAAAGPRSLDLAVGWFDWAWDGQRFDPARATAMLAAYEAVFPLPAAERKGLPRLLRFVTARFSVTRFWDFEVNRQPGVERLVKNYQDAWQRISGVDSLAQIL